MLQLQEPLVPPINFAMACPGVYRSGYPTKKNYPFLRALRLRSILYLCPEEYAESNLKFCEENAINVLRFPTEGNKEPFNDISERLMHRIMSALVDARNLPLLIHCNKGKHRTGTVVAALRLLQGWSLVSIFEEYKRFAGDKARVSDQTYVELYYPIVRITPPYVASWLVVTPRVRVVYSDKELLEEENAQLGHSLLAPVNPHADALHVATVAAAVAAKTASIRHADPATTTAASSTAPTSGSPAVAPSASPMETAAGRIVTNDAATPAASSTTTVPGLLPSSAASHSTPPTVAPISSAPSAETATEAASETREKRDAASVEEAKAAKKNLSRTPSGTLGTQRTASATATPSSTSVGSKGALSTIRPSTKKTKK